MRASTARKHLVLGLLAVVLTAAPANAQTITKVMTGLDAPRGLAFGPEGGLYVTEAGTGDASGPCAPVAAGMNCFSETGKITRLYKGKQERVVTDLPSVFNTARGDMVGPNDIAFEGRGACFVTIGWGGAPAARAALGATVSSLVGTLIKVNRAEDGALTPTSRTSKTPTIQREDRGIRIRMASLSTPTIDT